MTVIYDRVALIGLGLIAGSMSHAIREKGLAAEVVGFARSAETRDVARDIGLCDRITDSAAEAVADADLIVLAGNLGVEQAASAAGTSIEVPFAAGRVDASQEQTDVHSVEYLRGPADGFRNWKADGVDIGDEVLLIDKEIGRAHV